jgi:hypothetical protein
MRVLGLAFDVLFAVTVPIATHANGPRSNIGGELWHDSERFMDDNRSGKRLFRAQNGEFQSLPLGNFFVGLRPEVA